MIAAPALLWSLLAGGFASPGSGFDVRCAPCHGAGGRGDGPAAHLYRPPPRDLVAAPFTHGDDRGAIERTIRQGRPATGMPAFGTLPEAEIAALVDEVVRLRVARPAGANPTVPADLDAHAVRGEAVWGAAGCTTCHGPEGAGDGPAAPPGTADLRAAAAKSPVDLFATVTHGRKAMPAFGAVLPVADRWAVVAALRARGAAPASDAHGALPPPAQRRAGIADRLWPSRPLPAQGTPPTGLVPARRTLDARACGRCHPAEHAAWRVSRHALAAGPGVRAQLVDLPPEQRAACNACHAPLAEQQDAAAEAVEGRETLGGEGVNCAGCHVRGHEKLGPTTPVRRRLPAARMRATPEPRLTRADACLPCHNLPLDVAVAGRPLLDTWREWAASPYLPAGVQCQHCHLADGDHGFSGAHDPDAVRKAVRLSTVLEADELQVESEISIYNIAAGHHFPTTSTPRGVLRARQLDGTGAPIADTEALWAIGRTVTWDGRRWTEVADTRIPAGGVGRWTYRRPRASAASRLEVSLHFFPDWYYAGLYRDRLRRAPAEPARAQYARALKDAEGSGFLVAWERLPLP